MSESIGSKEGFEFIEERGNQFLYLALKKDLPIKTKSLPSFEATPPSFEDLFLFFSKEDKKMERVND